MRADSMRRLESLRLGLVLSSALRRFQHGRPRLITLSGSPDWTRTNGPPGGQRRNHNGPGHRSRRPSRPDITLSYSHNRLFYNGLRILAENVCRSQII